MYLHNIGVKKQNSQSLIQGTYVDCRYIHILYKYTLGIAVYPENGRDTRQRGSQQGGGQRQKGPPMASKGWLICPPFLEFPYHDQIHLALQLIYLV